MKDEAPARHAQPGDDAIAKAHAIYTPRALALYDALVHGLSNRLAWRCPTARLLRLYADNLSATHLEAGVGTGFFIDRAARTPFERLVLLDINAHCLAVAARRLERFAPVPWQASLFAPLGDTCGRDRVPFQSIGLTYVLHCLPGSMTEKLGVVDHLRALMAPGAMLFGATILGRGIVPNGPARALLALYNRKGVFNNREDDRDSLEQGLKQRFDAVAIETQGCVAVFRAA
ncbi:MAG: class I SAM-dependent methyltransferase [Methyloceanibacter sp.]